MVKTSNKFKDYVQQRQIKSIGNHLLVFENMPHLIMCTKLTVSKIAKITFLEDLSSTSVFELNKGQQLFYFHLDIFTLPCINRTKAWTE